MPPCVVEALGAVLLPSGSSAVYELENGSHTSLDAPLEEDALTAAAVAPSGSCALLAHRSGYVRVHILPPSDPPTPPRTFRPFHSANVVAFSAVHPSSHYAALAAADGAIRVHDLTTLGVTHVLSAGAPITTLAFPPAMDTTILVVGCDDGSVRIFDLELKDRLPKQILHSHVARVTALVFPDAQNLVSTSLDAVLAVHSFSSNAANSPTLLTSRLPIVAAAALANGHVVIASSKPKLRVWDVVSRTEIATASLVLPFIRSLSRNEGADDDDGNDDDDDDNNESLSVAHIVPIANELLVVLSDQTLLRVATSSRASLRLQPRVDCGNLEEVYDVRSVPPRKGTDSKQIAVASNSPIVWLMTPPLPGCSQWTCTAALHAHAANVLAIDVATAGDACFAVSASRDKSAYVWRRGLSGRWSCLAVAEGHTDAVAAVALSRHNTSGGFFMVTAAVDRTLKVWSLDAVRKAADERDKKHAENDPKDGTVEVMARGCDIVDVTQSIDVPQVLTANWTILSHEKDVNAVAVSPDGSVIATGSQDRSLKLWVAESGVLLHACTGHKRGIWSVVFSPVDRIVASASGDASVKVWSVQNGNCLRTLQGHMAAVLRVGFLSRGTQITSCGADGLVKVWSTRTGECDVTMDGHEDRVWGLDVLGDGDELVSGGGDGRVVIWKDESGEVELAEAKRREQQATMAQAVDSAARAKEWSLAARGALELGMTQKLKNILSDVIVTANDPEMELCKIVRSVYAVEYAPSIGGKEKEEETEDESEKKRWGRIGQMILCCRDWNTIGGAKSAAVAAYMLQAIMSLWGVDELCDHLPVDKRPLVEALYAHCNRHIERVNQIATRVSIIEHTLLRMRSVVDVGVQPTLDGNSKKIRASGERPVARKKRKRRDEVDCEY